MENKKAEFDFDKVLESNSIDEFIYNLYDQVFNKKYYNMVSNKAGKKEIIYGFYIKLDLLNKDVFNNLHPLFKLFYNAKRKSKKFILGDINNTDTDNNNAEAIYYLTRAIYDVFYGSKNNKLDEELRIYKIDDLIRISKDISLSRKLCNYLLSYVDNLLLEYTREKSNPDFYYDSKNRKYIPIYYNFIDKENEKDKLELMMGTEYIDDEEQINTTGDMTKYILDTYVPILTKAQRKFVNAFIEYGVAKDGNIYNYQNELVYTKQNVNWHKNKMRKILGDMLKEDVHIDNKGNRWIYRK